VSPKKDEYMRGYADGFKDGRAALREALDAYQERARAVGGCGDGGCVVQRPVGMHTNGGCRCNTDRMKAGRMMMAGQTLAAAVRAALALPSHARFD
jgi:hypothetical protein